VAAEIIILLVISSVEKLILGLETFYDLLTSLEKLGQVVDKELEPQGGEEPFGRDEGFFVELKDVTYRVPDRDKVILDRINMKITPTCTILLKGVAGSGKSTLLRLIAGILQPDSGQIFVNQVSLKGVNLNYYRSHLGQSMPEESPFEGTILDNLTFGDTTIPMDRVYWALEKTRLLTFVKEQPLGLKTILYPEGKQIPYTVGKKLVLARSILRNPKLLLLKDPLDHFNPEEADEVMQFLTDPSNGWALVVVSDNEQWASRCGRVIHIQEGKIIKDN
jgi:ABC-type bacteriocin/lantibiotic exporter with double-glycine peptidase domain